MGSSQSSHAKGIKRSSLKKNSLPLGVRGRKSMISKTGSAPHGLMASVVSLPSEHLHELRQAEELDETSAMSVHSDDANVHQEFDEPIMDESVSDSESDTESDDEMEYEMWEDRMIALEDARQLKQTAMYFLHPELPVASSAGARCFFDRFAAPRVSPEEADEKAMILAEAAVLKQVAAMFHHPEAPVAADDATRFGRNYFTRPDAYNEDEERLRILEDARQLKETAAFFLHPETPVSSSTGARCFFDRASAPVVSDDEADEKRLILADAAALKRVAAMYQHPEYVILADDATRFGRNFYSRPSANGVDNDISSEEDDELWEERLRVLHETRQLKETARYFLHPEAPVQASTGARCFFDRMSAPRGLSEEEADVKSAILADTVALKKAADMYLHPEAVVPSTVGARCYFDRMSAPEVSDEEAGEAYAILADAAALKEAASAYLHPEAPVASAMGARCYFDRISAPAAVLEEETDEANAILADTKALKDVASVYLHPEAPVPSVMGARCFFDRFSAPVPLTGEEADEASAILSDAAALKQVASNYLHPEKEVVVEDPTLFGRNYFTRSSAVVSDEMDDDFDERLRVLEEARQLKQLATYFLHPEVPVTSSNGSRCFFDRISAPDVVSDEESDERNTILADASALKSMASMFQHPEVSVVNQDPTSFGRNYFSRPSAYDDSEDKERALILSELKALKKAATDFLHPELPVEMADSAAFGRNYFNRYSAPDTESPEEANARSSILEDAALLKTSAAAYAHPEVPVVTTDALACGRNYFGRFSATETESMDDMNERDQVLADSVSIKKLVVDYMHPERPMTGNGSCARNYFDRPSSTLHHQLIHTFPAHEDDWGDDHHEHVDHFGMDEEMELFADLRERLSVPFEQGVSKVHTADSDVGSNLSRSPSSVMLFGMDESNNYD